MPKMRGYVKTFKVKEGDKEKNNKLMSFGIDDEKILEKYKAIWAKIENLKSIELNALSVYDDRYIKTKIRTFDYKVYTDFRGLNVSEDDTECESFIVFSIDSLNVTCKYIWTIVLIKLQTKKWQIILMKIFLKTRYYNCCITKELI